MHLRILQSDAAVGLLRRLDPVDALRQRPRRYLAVMLLDERPHLGGGHVAGDDEDRVVGRRSEEHTSELQSLMRISYAVFCLKKKIIYLIIKSLNSRKH